MTDTVCSRYPTVVGSIMEVGALTRCVLLHFECDLKAMQMNVQRRPIRQFMLYEFEVDHSATEATKNIYCAKREGAVDISTVTKC